MVSPDIQQCHSDVNIEDSSSDLNDSYIDNMLLSQPPKQHDVLQDLLRSQTSSISNSRYD